MHKAAAQIVAETILKGVDRRRWLACWMVDHGSSSEHFQAIVYLWRDKHGFARPKG